MEEPAKEKDASNLKEQQDLAAIDEPILAQSEEQEPDSQTVTRTSDVEGTDRSKEGSQQGEPSQKVTEPVMEE